MSWIHQLTDKMITAGRHGNATKTTTLEAQGVPSSVDVISYSNKKAVLPQGNRAMLQLFVSV